MKTVLSNYDKDYIKDNIEISDVFRLLEEWGAEPYYSGSSTIISKTICHHTLNEDASHKLYYYHDNQMFQCWTNCGGFDIFQLVIKVMQIRYNKTFDLNQAVRWIAYYFGIEGTSYEINKSKDWDIFNKYDELRELEINNGLIILKEYDNIILNRLNYNVKITPWLNEDIKQDILDEAFIGYYPGGNQITIPHYDKDNRLVGIRGRTVCAESAQLGGKYRPLLIGNTMYNHPLGMNLYNLNLSQDNIRKTKLAIVFESEKSCLKYRSYFGPEADISVAVCGSNLTYQQVELLKQAGAHEIIIAFDKQWQTKGDNEYQLWVKKLYKIDDRYKNDIRISFIFDKENLLNYKSSPIDEGKDKFIQLCNKRVSI